MKRKAKLFSRYKNSSHRLASTPLFALLALTFTHSAYAEPKVFQAIIMNDVLLERQYESRTIELRVNKTSADDHFLNESVIRGEAGFDAITGRMIIELDQLTKSGMPMKIMGFVVDKDQERGVDACTLWQTRMFENTKLCYAAEVRQGIEVKVVVSIDDLHNSTPATNQNTPGLAVDKRP